MDFPWDLRERGAKDDVKDFGLWNRKDGVATTGPGKT